MPQAIPGIDDGYKFLFSTPCNSYSLCNSTRSSRIELAPCQHFLSRCPRFPDNRLGGIWVLGKSKTLLWIRYFVLFRLGLFTLFWLVRLRSYKRFGSSKSFPELGSILPHPGQRPECYLETSRGLEFYYPYLDIYFTFLSSCLAALRLDLSDCSLNEL